MCSLTQFLNAHEGEEIQLENEISVFGSAGWVAELVSCLKSGRVFNL